MQAPFQAAYDAMLARWPGPVEAIDLRSRFGTTRVNACGPAGAPPVILLPGGGTTSTVWYASVGGLSDSYRVYAIDVIGDRGRTVYNGDPVRTLTDLLEWLDGCLSKLDILRARLVGHSYGAWFLLRYALAKAHRVERLALLDPTQCFTRQRIGYLAYALPLLLLPTPANKRRFFDVAKLTANARRLVPRVTVHIVPGATHHTMPMAPADVINGHLLEFLA